MNTSITTKKKILIIDDESRIRDIYVRMCQEAGLEAFKAGNGQEATDILLKEDLDLVLLDIFLPGMDGKSIFDIIHRHNPSLKVIVASVYPLHSQKHIIPHAFDYYDKCHGPTLLLDKILKAVGDHKPQT